MYLPAVAIQCYNMLMQEGEKAINWKYTGGDKAPAGSPSAAKAVGTVSWSASEYVEHDKSAGWYVRFALLVILVSGVIFVITRDVISVVLMLVLAVVFGIFAARKPDVLQYKLDGRGITIGQKMYPISLFRSFAIVEEGAFHSITLLPLKRFMPPISLHYAPEDEAAILDAFGNLLPQETRKQDAVDKFMHRIRF